MIFYKNSFFIVSKINFYRLFEKKTYNFIDFPINKYFNHIFLIFQ